MLSLLVTSRELQVLLTKKKWGSFAVVEMDNAEYYHEELLNLLNPEGLLSHIFKFKIILFRNLNPSNKSYA